MNRRDVPEFLELPHIQVPVEKLREVWADLHASRKNEKTEFRFADIRSELAESFPFKDNGYDYVAVTDLDPALRDTVVKASSREMYKLGRRGLAAAMDDRQYTHFREDVPELLRTFLEQFKGQLARVRFATLKCRQTIYEHIDNDISHTVRVHVPLIADQWAVIGVRGVGGLVVRHLEVGKVYFVNTSLPHFAMNSSRDVDRTHLVVNLNSLEDLVLAGMQVDDRSSEHQGQ